jgi:THO complex subunit 2
MAEYVTDQVTKDWEKGKAKLMVDLNSIHQGYESKDMESRRVFKKIIFELIDAIMAGRLAIDKVIQFLKSEEPAIFKDLTSVVVDVIWLIAIKTERKVKDDKIKQNLYEFVQQAMKQGFLPRKMLLERLDRQFLAQAKVIAINADVFGRKEAVIRTKRGLTQNKFNLFREESEGYSKLLTELNTPFDAQTVHGVMSNVRALIGHFDLDPNRVFDIVLDAFEQHVDNTAFLPLVYIFPQAYLAHILGFKYQFYQSENRIAPKSLHRLTATLIKHQVLALDEIYPHLKPEDEEMASDAKKKILDAKKEARSIGAVNLTAKPAANTNEKKDKKAERDEQLKPLLANQKLGLLEALLDVHEWKTSDVLLKRLFSYFPAQHPGISALLCQRIHYTIEPLYRPLSINKETPKEYVKQTEPQATTMIELQHLIFPLLKCLGPYLHLDTILFFKVCRVLKNFFKKNAPKPPPEFTEEVEVILADVLMPSLQLLPANPAASNEVWDILVHYHYEVRYRLYYQWKTSQKYPALIVSRAEAANEAKKLLRRISTDNVRSIGRQLGRITHSAPFPPFEQILGQIQTYTNIIKPVVDTVKYVSNLTCDVLSYLLLEKLVSSTKQEIKEEGLSIATWLQGLSQFCGYLFQKFGSRIELKSMLTYMAQQIRTNHNPWQVLVISEIIGHMANIRVLEDIYDEQVLAQSAGPVLHDLSQAQISLEPAATRRQFEPLADAIIKVGPAQLYAAFAQLRAASIYGPNAPPSAQLAAYAVDQGHVTTLQFAAFVKLVLTQRPELRTHLPDLTTLVKQYQVTTEYAFHLLRPFMNHFYTDVVQREEVQQQVTAPPTAKLVDTVRELFDDKTTHISAEWYATFWTLRLSDIHVPVEQYNQFVKSQQQKQAEPGQKKEQQTQLEESMSQLKSELKRFENVHKHVMKQLEHDKKSWFASWTTETADLFLEQCLIPRMKMTLEDAMFSAKLLFLLHQLQVPNYNLLDVCNKFFDSVSWILYGCTDQEAARVGLFVKEVLITFQKWRTDRNLFDASGMTAMNNIDYKAYRKMLATWERENLLTALTDMLASRQYVEMRSALLALTKLVQVYPSYRPIADLVEENIVPLKTDEDLKTLAQRYSAQLESQKASMMSADDMNRDLDIEIEAKPVVANNNNTSSKSQGESKSKSHKHEDPKDRKSEHKSEPRNSKERESKDHKSAKSSSHEDKDAEKRKRPSERGSSERPEKVAKTSKDDTPSATTTKDREREVPKVSSSVKMSVPSSVSVKKESGAIKRPREEGALEDDREKKIPRIGSSSSATGQDKPRDKNVSSSDRKPEKESSNNNASSRGHKDREHESRSGSSRIVEIERPSSRGAPEKKDKKEVKEESRDGGRPRRLDRSYGMDQVKKTLERSDRSDRDKDDSSKRRR